MGTLALLSSNCLAAAQGDACLLFPIWRVYDYDHEHPERHVTFENIQRADSLAIMRHLGGPSMDVVGKDVGVVEAGSRRDPWSVRSNQPGGVYRFLGYDTTLATAT